MDSLISIIIPVYNVEKYIHECVESVVNQTYKNLEIILVDDGSTDSSGKLCDEFAEKCERIRVIHKTNGGLSSARNAGIEVATGDYLFFLDSDDYITRNAIEVLYSVAIENDADISIGRMERTTLRYNSACCDNISKSEINLYTSQEALVEMLYGRNYSTSAGGKLFRRGLFDDLEFPDGRFSEDLFTIYKTILRTKRVCYVSVLVYCYYYRREGSIVVSKYSKKHLEAIEAVDNIVNDTLGMDVKVKRAIAAQYINVVYDIAGRKIDKKDFGDERIIGTIKEHRRSVTRDIYAAYRLRLFSMISFISPIFAMRCVYMYNWIKWKISS